MENEFIKVSGCDRYVIKQSGQIYRVVDLQTGEVMCDFFLFIQAVQYAQMLEMPCVSVSRIN